MAESRLGSTTVTLPLELELDLGNLLAIDPNTQEFTEEQVQHWKYIKGLQELLPRQQG